MNSRKVQTATTTPAPDAIISLAAAGKLAPLGPVSPVAAWRWASKGVLSRDGRRVRLQTVKQGRKLGTTRAWMDDFFRACGNAGGAV